MGDISQLLGESFKPEDVPPSEYELLPEGDYPVIIESVTLKTTQKNGVGLVFVFSVLGTHYDGRRVNSFINIVNANPKAETIGRQELAQLCIACGLQSVNDTKELVGKKLKLRVVTKKGEGTYINKYGEEKPSQDQNEVKKYLSLNAVTASPKLSEAQDERPQETQEVAKKSRPWA